ncbi:OmpP1/FadL family transporter [Geomonas propionica]|uniref:Outer membrane protein transport protein n=1 Tax=Geomonas propionica TaxID=2798582 RepID=A0ABS0YUY7_9BACT|nr:outer membrane protein transport protein [Geomonas propionica]MBJ6801741.1 outer membrane protein transport protein [Geomonas propionica]
MRKWLLCVLVLCALPGLRGVCHGAGFKVSEQGAKAMAMGNAFAAQADDPSALYFNPGGIAFLPGIQVNLGSTGIIVPQTEFQGTTPLSGTPPLDTGATTVTERSRRDIVIAPTLYATYALENLPVTLGLGVNATYPLSKSWSDSSVFRNQVQIASIKPINFQPTAAYRFDNLNLGVAAGIDVTYAVVTLQKSLYAPVIDPTAPAPPFGAYELGSLGVDGTATDVGYNFGLLWKPRGDLNLGLAYRSKITLDIKGDANFLATTPTGLGAIGLADSALSPYTRARASSDASTSITLPDTLDLAVAWRPTDKVTLEFDATRTGWSSFKKLELHFDSAQVAAFNNQPDPRNWRDVWSYKFGAQYQMNQRLALRAGYSFDESPVPNETVDPLLPDADRHSFSVGAGIGNAFGTLDLAYMWVHFVDRTVHNQDMTTLRGANGIFKSDAYLLAANLNLKF